MELFTSYRLFAGLDLNTWKSITRKTTLDKSTAMLCVINTNSNFLKSRITKNLNNNYMAVYFLVLFRVLSQIAGWVVTNVSN
jgi:hypothetical protein